MPGPISSNGTAVYLEANFADAYNQSEVTHADSWGTIFDMLPDPGLPTPKFAYHETAPYPERWRRGDERMRDGFKSVTWTTSTYDYSVEVAWHKNDEQDDQLKGVVRKAREAGDHWGSLNARIGTQMIENGTDRTLLPGIPNAPDGAAMYSTTDGASAARFGATNGNLLTGSGTTGAYIRTDLFSAIEQFLLFQDTEGQPLWDANVIERGLLVMYPVGLMREFAEAFVQSRTVHIDTGAATTDPRSGAPVTNVVMESGLQLKLYPNPRLSDTVDWYVFLQGTNVKPLYRFDRQPLTSHIQDESNSDEARKSGIRSVMWDARHGFGVGPVYSTIKINNT